MMHVVKPGKIFGWKFEAKKPIQIERNLADKLLT